MTNDNSYCVTTNYEMTLCHFYEVGTARINTKIIMTHCQNDFIYLVKVPYEKRFSGEPNWHLMPNADCRIQCVN